MKIREANLADADQLFPLARAFATSFEPTRQAFDVSLAQLVSRQSAKVLVAEEEGQIIGYCLGFDHPTFYANGPVVWVEEITVSEAQRRRGIGRLLMEAFETWARSREAKLLGLATRRAAPFYLALGYRESATYFRKLL